MREFWAWAGERIGEAVADGRLPSDCVEVEWVRWRLRVEAKKRLTGEEEGGRVVELEETYGIAK